MHLDPNTLAALMAPIRHAVGAEGFARSAAAALAPVFASSRAVFVQRPPRVSPGAARSADEVHFVDWPLWCKPHYCSHLRARDPIRRWLERGDAAHQGGVVRLSDLVPARKMLRSDYHRSMLRPTGAAFVLTRALGQRDEPRGALSLVRDAGTADFSDDDQRLAMALAPVLAVAYAVASERGARDADTSRLAHALGGDMFFAIEADGRLCARTAAAAAIEHAWTEAGLAPAARHRLQQAVATCGARTIELPIAGPCEIRCTHDVAGRTAGLLVIALRTGMPAAPAPVFHALTARERQVVDLVLRGHANKDIARVLGTSP